MLTTDLRREMDGHLGDFEQLAADYRQELPEDQQNIDLKREHSLRVLANAALIANSERFAAFERRAALLAALYHDTGRFPQYAAYKTFRDAESENHGQLGVKTLRQRELPTGAPPDMQRLVRSAVMLHNRRYLPERISPQLAAVTMAVRDADKLDIMRVMLEHFSRTEYQNPVVTLSVKDDPKQYTALLYSQVMSGELGDYASMKWVNDFKLMLLSWAYGMHFAAGRRLLLERNLAGQLLDTMTQMPNITPLREKVLADLENATEDDGV